MRRRLSGLEGKRVLKGTGQAVLATTVMVLVLLGWLGLTHARQPWLVGGGGVLLGGIVYFLLVLILKVPEVRTIFEMLRHRFYPATK